MTNIQYLIRLGLLGISSTMLLHGCGGSSSGEDEDQENPETEIIGNPEPTGIFVDAPVAGLSYQQGSREGTTDEHGTFTYDPNGDPMTFSVGAYRLGQSAPTARVTPHDLTVDSVQVNPINVARFLQSLDHDQNPDNGIDLTQAAAQLNTVTVDLDFTLSDEQFDTSFNNFWTQTGREGQPVTAAQASTALQEGTISAFAHSDIANRMFYYEIIGQNGLDGSGLIAFGSRDGILNTMADFQSHGGHGDGEGDGDRNFSWTLDNGTINLEYKTESLASIQRLSSTTVDATTRFSAVYTPQGAEPIVIHLTQARVPQTPQRFYLRGNTGELFHFSPISTLYTENESANITQQVCQQGRTSHTWHSQDFITSTHLNLLQLRPPQLIENADPLFPGNYLMQFGGRSDGYNYLYVDVYDHPDGWFGWTNYFWAKLEQTQDERCP